MFKYKHFSCDVDIFRNQKDIIVRFYDKSKEQSEAKITDLVIVEPGYGYICLKFKGDHEGLLSGFLDRDIFHDENMVDPAITFVESLSPLSDGAYLPYHIDLISRDSYVEYNGEY